MFLKIFLLFLYTQMSQGSVMDFFPNSKENLTKISWAHAVNNKSLLENALKSNVMMLEADVSYGKLSSDDSSELIPIMAHPPADTSDLSLQQFLINVTEHNAMTEQKKGVKLDFKSINAFDASVNILKEISDDVKYPIWLNADILKGPVNATTEPVDAKTFLKNSKQLNNFTLSVGWTTSYNQSVAGGVYTGEQIDSMINILSETNISQVVTFPVRAGLAAESKTVLKKLLASFSNATFTIWSSAGDPVDIQKLRSFILDIGVDKIYLDVPEDVANKLHLESSSNCAGNVGLFSLLLSTAVMIFTSEIL